MIQLKKFMRQQQQKGQLLGSEYYRILQLLGEKDLEDVQEITPFDHESKNPMNTLRQSISLIKNYKSKSKITNVFLDIYHLRSNNAVINYVNKQDRVEITQNPDDRSQHAQSKKVKILSFSNY